jgi:MTH538 TIR-like domain (DUF1863)
MADTTPARLTDAVRRARTRERSGARRRRCFVSYHHEDMDLVADFISGFGDVFVPTALGVTDSADFVESEDQDYIKRRIRELYLASTTVTIVIAGSCTWSRRFIDWEIAASLRDAPRNKRSGLLAVAAPGAKGVTLPDRIGDNWVDGRPDASYAEVRPYPNNGDELRDAIEAAFSARTAKSNLVDNSRPLRTADSRCR